MIEIHELDGDETDHLGTIDDGEVVEGDPEALESVGALDFEDEEALLGVYDGPRLFAVRPRSAGAETEKAAGSLVKFLDSLLGR